jgi:hypothetical protein
LSDATDLRYCGRMSRLLMVAVVLAGCASVDYVGKTYAPTSNVDVYMSADDVSRPYEVMGEARAQVDTMPFSKPGQQLQDKLVAEARAKGADGIILGQLQNRTTGSTSNTVGQGQQKKKSKSKKKTQYTETTTTSDSEVTELRGQLIRYR